MSRSEKEELFAENAQKLIRHVIKKHLSALKFFETFEDMEQHLLLKVWKALDKFDLSRGKISTFIIKVCINEINMVIRKAQALKRKCEIISFEEKIVSLIDENSTDYISLIEYKDLIAKIIPRLSSESYDYFIRGKTQKDIAKNVGMSQSYIGRKIKVNINKIKKEIFNN